MLYCHVESKFVISHFNINHVCDYTQYRNNEQGLIKHFILSPLFLNQGRFIVKEILRQVNVSCLLYVHYVEHPPITIPDIVKIMCPIKPFELMEYPPDDLKENIPLELIMLREPPSALHMITKRITSLTQATRHVHVTVAGASPLSLAFLETLIFKRDPAEPLFTRITLATKHGIWQRPHKYQKLAESMMINNGFNIWHYVASLNIAMWVTVREGCITEINVREKYLTMSYTENKQNYKYLFLGIQLAPRLFALHQIKPKKLNNKDEFENDNSETALTRQSAFEKFTHEHKHIPRTRCESKLMQREAQIRPECSMKNVFCIANIVDAAKALIYLENLIQTKRCMEPILIIGQCLNALACLHSCLELGAKEAGKTLWTNINT